MSFRKRTTRTFTPPPPKDSISVISQVVAPTPTRVTRFTPTPTPTPPRPTGTITRRVTVSPTPRPTPTRVTRFTPRPTPTPRPRDDFQRSLSVFPVAFAEETPPIQERAIQTRPRQVQVAKPRVRTARFTPVRAVRKDVVTIIASPLTTSPISSRQFEVPLSEQQKANQALLDAGVPTFAEAERQRGLSERDIQIGSFGGGVIAEIQNLRSIVDPNVIPTREVGSLALDLPFAVAGETFTTPSAEGEAGFLGLGFDFRSTPDFEAGFEKSGEIQAEIGQKFEEDPARAVGSIFAVGAVEATLLITTGGVGNLARRGIIQVGKQIATTKGRKVAEKVAREQPAAKKGIPQLIENLGDGRFAILQGFEQIGKRVGSIRVLKGGGVVAQTTTKSGKIVEKELDLITGITVKGTRGKLKGKRIKVTAKVEKQADVPLIIVDTKSRLVKSAVSGRVTKERPRTFLFNKNIPDRSKFLNDPNLLNIVGADEASIRIIGKQTGLKGVKGKRFALVSEGKIPQATLRSIEEAEKFGQIRASARGISVLTKDASSKKGGLGNLIGEFAVRQEPIVRSAQVKLSSAEIIEGIRIGSPTPRVTERLKGIPFGSVEIFGARNVGGRSLSNFLSPDTTKIGVGFGKTKPRGKGKRTQTTERADDFNVLDPFAPSTKPRTVLVKGKPSPKPRTQTQAIFEAFTTPARKVKPVRVPVGARVAVGTVPLQVRQPTRVKDDFAIFQGEVIGQLPRQRTRQVSALDEGLIFGQTTRTVQTPRLRDRPVTTPFFRQEVVPRGRTTPQVVIPTFQTGTPPPTTIFQPVPPRTPSGLGGGLPSPFFPPSDAERRRRGTKGRRSRLGGRLFDIADEPFGEVAVGLGFFVETERGETSIEEALGIGDDEFEPITRQEKQARARLGKGRKRRDNIDDIFDVGGLFG